MKFWIFLCITFVFQLVSAQRDLIPDAIIMGASVKVKQEASHTSQVLFSVRNGTSVKIISVSNQKSAASKERDTCNYYPWIEVEFPDRKTGFVLGKNVFHLDEKPLLTVGESPELGCSPFMLFSAKNYGLRSFIEGDEGERFHPGCEDYSIMVFYLTRENTLCLLELDEPVTERFPDVKYWLLVEDPARTDKIIYLSRIEAAQIKVTVHSKYKEGCGGYELRARICGTSLSGRVLGKFRRTEEADCR